MRRLLLITGLALSLAAPGALRAQAVAVTPGNEVLSLRPGDLLRVRVWPDSSLGGDFPIEADGGVLLPVVGAVQVSGQTLAALRRELRQQYAQAMKLPVVTVIPVFHVSVLGGVMRPGLYEVDPNMTLFDVISLAGGFSSNARENQVRVVRQGAVLPVDARAALATGNLPESLRLRSGDRIVVDVKHSGLGLLYFMQVVTVGLAIVSVARH
jgi:polysaccharide export outer membrane protein